MSVLNCSRRGCENVMCDRYSYKYGYICDECFEEMAEMTNFESIEDFMNSEIKFHRTGNSYEVLDEIFHQRY